MIIIIIVMMIIMLLRLGEPGRESLCSLVPAAVGRPAISLQYWFLYLIFDHDIDFYIWSRYWYCFNDICNIIMIMISILIFDHDSDVALMIFAQAAVGRPAISSWSWYRSWYLYLIFDHEINIDIWSWYWYCFGDICTNCSG